MHSAESTTTTLSQLPEGYSELYLAEKLFRITKHTADSGSITVEAFGPNKDDYVSFNYYPELGSNQLKPCGVPMPRVEQFLAKLHRLLTS